MRRLALFVRSVIPLDPTQLFFLVGSVLLLICMQLRCHPLLPSYALKGSYGDAFVDEYQSWLLFSIVARLPIVLAGAAGLFVCYWPGLHPFRRILGFVVFPSFAGIAALCVRFLYVSQQSNFPHASVMQRGPHNEAWAFSTVWTLGPALHMSVLGFALVIFLVSRLAAGVSTLPVSLPPAGDVLPGDDKIWKRILVFVWISITCISAIGALANTALEGFYFLLAESGTYRSSPPGDALISALSTACLVAIAAWAVGEGRWIELRQFTRSPETKFAVLGVIFPTVIELVPSVVAYVSDRIHWAAFLFGQVDPPFFPAYFLIPNPLFLWYLPAAFFEEIIWRGYLQPRFVHRFGILRGIFLLAIAWSAFHFLGDFLRMTEDHQVFVQFFFRISSCVAISYVLGWLTLRSGSIWPAAIAHGLSNIWVLTMVNSLDGHQSPFSRRIIVTVCWGLLGFALFRFWPPSIATEVSDQPESIATEPST
ncbi:MAG: CPBP family intramembrane glutamic endopeptidase [Candidatus Acidiferrales bacterium]|jgi:membrane protease YdiL (CAAX protease family)